MQALPVRRVLGLQGLQYWPLSQTLAASVLLEGRQVLPACIPRQNIDPDGEDCEQIITRYCTHRDSGKSKAYSVTAVSGKTCESMAGASRAGMWKVRTVCGSRQVLSDAARAVAPYRVYGAWPGILELWLERHRLPSGSVHLRDYPVLQKH